MVDGILGLPQGGPLASAAKDTLLLRPGQILPGTVLEVNSENAVVLINGVNVVAELATPVSPGERLLLQVVDQRSDGKVLLQKISSQEIGTEGQPSLKDIETVLDQLGIKNSKLNETIVKELLQLKTPVAGRTVELLSGFALKNNISAKEAPALTWLWARGLPITRDSISAMVSLMERGVQDTKMGELLQVLNEDLSVMSQELLPGGTQTAEESGDLSSQGRVVGNEVMKVVEELLLVPEESPGQWGQKLGDALKNLGLGHERDVLRLLEQLSRDPESLKDIKDPSNFKDISAFKDVGDLKGVRDLKDFAVFLKGRESKTLKSALLEMLKPEWKASGEDMMSTNKIAHGMLKDITGFQLLNITGRQEADGITTFIPGWMSVRENEIQPFFLKVKKYLGGNDSLKEDIRCQVLFFISTKGMGEVMCRLALENNCLTCGFTVRGQEECRLIDSLLPVLQQRMEALPWKTVIHPSKVLRSEEILETWYEETFVAHERSFKGLDARV